MARRVSSLFTWVAVTIALCGASSIAVGESPPQYRVTRIVALGAPDRWDYVIFDPASKRVYVAHGDQVTVVHGEKGTILGSITGLPGGTHGIALVSEVGRGYTDDGEAGQAASFDLRTLSVTGRIKAAEDADAIAFDPYSGHVFVINGYSGTITVIDPKSNSALTTIEGGGKLEYAVADGHGRLYVNGAGNREVLHIDTGDNHLDAHWPVPACTSPHGLGFDPLTRRLNKLLVAVDADGGKVIASLPIGAGTDGVAFDPKRKLILSSNGLDGTLSVIRENDAHSFTTLKEIKTVRTARTIGIDPTTGRLYLAAADIQPGADTGPAKAGAPRRPPLGAGVAEVEFSRSERLARRSRTTLHSDPDRRA